MRVRVTVVTAPDHADVWLHGPAGSALDRFVEPLQSLLGRDLSGLHLAVDGAPVPWHTVVGRPPLVDGCVLTFGSATAPVPGPRSILELACIEGPGAGRVTPIAPGTLLIGRSPGADIPVPDPTLSRLHARLEVDRGGAYLTDLASTNGCRVNGDPLAGRTVIHAGDRLRLGHSTVVLRLADDVGAGRPAGRTESAEREYRLPAAPTPGPAPGPPAITLVVPVVIAALTAALLHSTILLMLGVAATVAGAVHLVVSRRHHARAARAAREAHRRDCSAVRDRLERDRAVELAQLRARFPDPVALLDAPPPRHPAGDPPADADLGPPPTRVGIGRVQSTLTLIDPDATGPRTSGPERTGPEETDPEKTGPDVTGVLNEAPLTLPDDWRHVEVDGDRQACLALTRFVIGQWAWRHPDLRLALRCPDPDRHREWDWFGWLPNCRPDPGRPALLHLDGTGDRCVSLPPQAILICDAGGSAPPGPARTWTILDGPSVGDPAPGVLQLSVASSGRLVVRGGPRPGPTGAADPRTGVADLVDLRWSERLARRVAGLDRCRRPGGLTTEIGLLGLLPFDPRDPATLGTRWRHGHPATVIGVGDGGPVSIDLTVHGPHLLIAGTTGAGKSELLRTLVVGLAIAAPPAQVSFVLVDYKGGAAFGDCRRLPHVVGLVTDLDHALTARALRSLGAEVRRRERLLAEAGVRDLRGYQSQQQTAGLPPLGRLVIVVDEFRVLTEELPDFVSGLVRLATVGRALGLHLVLATQRPAGVVSADIRANVGLRIALRVADPLESRDVVDCPDAARLDPGLPGRAVLRHGAEPPVLLQCATVDGDAGGCTASRAGFQDLGRPAAQPATGGPPVTRAVIEAIRTAAVGLPVPPSPWLPPLPSSLLRDDLPRLPTRDADGIPLGLVDDPERQRQVSAGWVPARDGALLVIGGSGSGRTTLVGTVVDALPTGTGYLIDGTRTLDALSARSQVAALADGSDLSQVGRLLDELGRPGRHPRPVLVLHCWEQLNRIWSRDLGGTLERVIGWLRQPGTAWVATGGRALATGALGELTRTRLVLGRLETADSVVAGAPRDLVPAVGPPGRGVLVRDGTAYAIQTPGPPPPTARGDP